jgi:hypothetical protein
MSAMMNSQRSATVAKADEALKSAHASVKIAASVLHFDLGQFARLEDLSNELSTEIEYLKRYDSELSAGKGS